MFVFCVALLLWVLVGGFLFVWILLFVLGLCIVYLGDYVCVLPEVLCLIGFIVRLVILYVALLL